MPLAKVQDRIHSRLTSEMRYSFIDAYISFNLVSDSMLITIWCVQANLPEAVETIVGAVDGQHRGSGVGFRNSPVPLQDDHFCPNFVVDLVPFVQDLLDVILQQKP